MTTKKDFSLLATIVAAMANTDAPFKFCTEAELKGLLKDGLVEINSEIKNDAGAVATRASDKGVAANTEQAAKAEQPKPTSAAPVFVAGAGFVPPATARRERTELYNFDAMNVGDVIFVAKSDAKPDPAKSLASTVSGATKKYAVAVEGKTRVDRKGNTVPFTYPTRVFGIAPVEAGKAYGTYTAPGDGAVIYRGADYIPTDADKAPTPAPAAA
jgi:hypothetical protein